MNYPTHLGINYQTDSEYRKCFCQIIKYTLYPLSIIEKDNECIEDEPDDNWDTNKVNIFLDFILSKTSMFKIFNELYLQASSTMMMIDVEIGIAILFSFTYFKLFHQCLVFFFQQNDIELQHFPPFLSLKEMFVK